MTRTLALLPALALLHGPAASAAEPLGRLFFTPQQRAALDAGPRPARRPMAAADKLRLDGIVVRSSGKTTVWINGRPRHDNAADKTMRAAVSMAAPGRAAIVAGGVNTDLRVGESLDRGSHRRRAPVRVQVRGRPLPLPHALQDDRMPPEWRALF